MVCIFYDNEGRLDYYTSGFTGSPTSEQTVAINSLTNELTERIEKFNETLSDNNLCKCGNPKMDESDFCKECL